MTEPNPEEIATRLRSLERGPWRPGLDRARKLMAPQVPVAKGGPMLVYGITASDLTPRNKSRNRKLAVALRPLVDPGDVVDERSELELRDAFDEALTVLQLYELAVETGYFPIEAVAEPARNLMAELLWSPAARRFVEAYDYLALPMLASRIGLPGFGPARPPEPDRRAAVRFAGFLAELRSFYADDQVEVWTRFMDDYTEETDEQNRVWEYFQGRRKTAPERIDELFVGCQRFAASLARSFQFLDDEELGRFGLVHSYWLQKFFGYESEDGRWVRNDLWEGSDSWATTIANSAVWQRLPGARSLRTVYKRQFGADVKVLRGTFQAVQKLVNSSSRAGPL